MNEHTEGVRLDREGLLPVDHSVQDRPAAAGEGLLARAAGRDGGQAGGGVNVQHHPRAQRAQRQQDRQGGRDRAGRKRHSLRGHVSAGTQGCHSMPS